MAYGYPALWVRGCPWESLQGQEEGSCRQGGPTEMPAAQWMPCTAKLSGVVLASYSDQWLGHSVWVTNE